MEGKRKPLLTRHLWLVVAIHLIIIGLGFPSFAQERPSADSPPEMTLAAAIGLALRNNRTIQIAQVAREAEKFAVRLQESLFDPQVSLTTDVSVTKKKQSKNEISSLVNQLAYAVSVTPEVTLETEFGTSFTLQLNNSYGYTIDRTSSGSKTRRFMIDPELTIVQPLLKGVGEGVNTASLEIAKLNSKLGRLSMNNSVAKVITSIIQEYWNVLLNKENLRIAKLALERARQVLAINNDLVETGRMAKLDMVQAETNVAQKEFDLDVTDNAYKQSKNTLLSLLSLPKFIDFTPSRTGPIEMVTVPLDIAYNLADKNRFEIIQAEVMRALAKVALVVAEDGKKWELNLTGTAGSNNSRRSVLGAIKDVPGGANTLSIGMELIIPITSLSTESEVVSAKGDLRTAELQLEEARQTVRLDTQDAVRNVTANYRQLQLGENATALAEKQLAVERDKLSVGRSSNFQVLTYQDTLRTTQLKEVSARINYLNSLATLDFTLGTTLDTWNVDVTDETAQMKSEAPNSTRSLAYRPGETEWKLPPPKFQ